MHWRDKRAQKDQADKLEHVYSNRDGLNRRAFGLFPQPKERKPERIDLSNNVNYSMFLVGLEGQEETTCVRLISPQRKVRAAMLILRGRVLGCVYGRDNEGQCLGQEGYQKMTAEMLAGQVIVDAYKIDDKTAIAASAMFHGETFAAPSTMKPSEIFHFFAQSSARIKNARHNYHHRARGYQSRFVYLQRQNSRSVFIPGRLA